MAAAAGDAERECPRAADLPGRPGHRRRVGEGELGEALQPGGQRDPELHAGQVGSQAAVDAEAERGMPVDRPVDDDLVGPFKLSRIAVGRRVATSGSSRRPSCRRCAGVGTAPVHVFLGHPRHGDRRVSPQELLDRGRQQSRVGDEPAAVLRVLRQVPQGGADRAPGGVDAGDEQQGHRADDVRRVEPAAVELRVDQVGREVVTRVAQVVLDLREQVVEQRRHPRGALLGRQVDAFQRVLDELGEPRRVLRGKPEDAGYYPHRDVLRVVAGGIDDVLAGELVNERVAQFHRRGLLLADRRLGEPGEQQPARLMVERGVGGDRRRAAGRRQVARRPEVARDDRPGGKAPGVVRDGLDVRVAGGQPGAAEPLRVRDRAALSQVVLDRVGIGGPPGIEVGEVGRPVADRAGNDLAAGARGPAAPVKAVLSEAVVGAHVRPPRSTRSPARGSSPRPGGLHLPGRAARRRRP